jgi:hypothetical protein
LRAVAKSAEPEIASAPWYSPAWIEEVARGALQAFDRAFNRWRELYRAACEQRDTARRIIDDPGLRDRRQKEAAEQREREARREIELLLNRSHSSEGDFYTYRYLANEGFIPGYNFPRLPVRALVSGATEAHAIDRPRFLGLTEFGPGNVIYFEGRKHRVAGCVMPAGGIEARISRAKLCLACGYIHPRDEAAVDLCVHCGTRLDAATMGFPQALFEQPTVRATRWQRISSEEEERAREGYQVTTHFRFPAGLPARELMLAEGEEGEPLLEVRYVPQAEIWRINHGWRRSGDRNGFGIDTNTGAWQRQSDDDEPNGTAPRAVRGQIRPYVSDNRNLLLVRAAAEEPDEDFLRTLAYSLRRAIQLDYQIEEQEIQVELIGSERQRRIILWEAAEGGIGVWERLIEESGAFAGLARTALDLLHFDPATGDEKPGWAERCPAACYDCLLATRTSSITATSIGIGCATTCCDWRDLRRLRRAGGPTMSNMRGYGSGLTRHPLSSARFSTIFTKESSAFPISPNTPRRPIYSFNPISTTSAAPSPGSACSPTARITPAARRRIAGPASLSKIGDTASS